MRIYLLLFIILNYSICTLGQTVTRDFTTVDQLRNSTKPPKKGEKVYVIQNQNIYASDFSDNNSMDDGYNVIIQGNTRWKCVSCKIPSKCISQKDVMPLNVEEPTKDEISNFINSNKIPMKNGVLLNYHIKSDTLINPMQVYLNVASDSSKITSIKIDGIEKITAPIWIYQGDYVYVDNTLVNILEANKPDNVNYSVDDDLINSESLFVIDNIDGFFNLAITYDVYDGTEWGTYIENPAISYTYVQEKGSCFNPLLIYALTDSIVQIKGFELDLELGRTYIPGPRTLSFSSNSGKSTVIQNANNDIVIKDKYFFKNNSLALGEYNSAYGFYLSNKNLLSSSAGIEHAGNARPIFNLLRARGTSNSKQALQLNDKLGTFGFSGYDGQFYQSASLIEAYVDGPIIAGPEGVGQVPQRISIVTGYNFNNRAERLVIKGDGKIGVGTNIPSQLFSVNGKINVADDLINPTNGSIRYNASINKFQGYANGIWVDFH
jgi:hypothetical protein